MASRFDEAAVQWDNNPGRVDGRFHGQAEDVFHHGFERQQITEWLANARLTSASVGDAHSMTQTTSTGLLRTYGVFLALGQKGRD